MTTSYAPVQHSADSPEWYSPSPYVEAARDVMGGIDLDPASHAEANRTVKAAKYYTEAENGLMQEWRGRVYLNPPGGQVNAFWRKFCDEIVGGEMTHGMWIGFSVEQLQTLHQAGALYHPIELPICIPRARIAFIENEAKKAERIAKALANGKTPNEKSQPAHGNYIVYAGPNAILFEEVFSQFGKVRV